MLQGKSRRHLEVPQLSQESQLRHPDEVASFQMASESWRPDFPRLTWMLVPQVEGSLFSILPVATACPGCFPKFGTCSTSRLRSFILQPLPCHPHSLLHVSKTHFVPNEPNCSCFQRRSVIHIAIPAVTLSVPPTCLEQNSLAPAVRFRLPVAPVSKPDKPSLPSAALLSLGYGGCCTRHSL